jgi:adenine-specific DNA-methyltransferase
MTPAAPNFERLKAKLRELFELDKADLDFGIYRILRARHAEITTFLDQHLEQTVRDALQSHGGLQLAQIEEKLRKAESAARTAGFDPATSPIVQELRAQYSAGADLDALADEVYSHLYTFFARYYQEGDFLGLPRSTVQGREKYMIPYNGEEVKLVWANMDQYYIKSSELLRDYSFRIRRTELSGPQLSLLQASADEPAEVVIHFKLVEGDTEKDNRKPDGKTTRVFALDGEQPFVETDAVTLTLRFCYREQATEPNLQRKLNDLTEQTLAATLPAKWQPLLLAADPTYKGKDNRDTRTILQKHLRGYTARHQFDYFIHKDLGGFLRRELDFYIKNEVMHLDDIEGLAAPKAEEYLSKIRALRRCALPVIRMVAQLEEFQKKLWLKKKFVVETRYCLTLDRVPVALYETICANDAQWVEWEQLYALSAIEANLLTAPLRTPAFLHQQPHLMLDTRHFDRDFTLRLLASIDNLDETLDGVCFHAENFQALQLMQERYREQVKCIYIDPPYNTDASAIIYKNDYKDSSWISLIRDRISIAKELQCLDGILCTAIDDIEAPNLSLILRHIYGLANSLGVVVARSNPSGRSTPDGIAEAHDYAIFFARTEVAKVGRMPRTEKQAERYSEKDQDGNFEWVNFRKHGGIESSRAARPRMFYPIYAKNGKIRIPEMEWDQAVKSWKTKTSVSQNEEVVWPLSENGEEKRWKWGVESVIQNLDDFCAKPDQTGHTGIYLKSRINKEGMLPLTWWDKKEYSATEYGTNLLKNIFGKLQDFSFPKAIHLVIDCLRAANVTKTSIVLDYFAGSGSSGHAVISLNRKDEGARKYILVEMGEHFNTVLVPRLKKVVYATDWRDGKPQNRDTGLSHAFKIVRLESYEDTLNNLHLRRTPAQEATLRQATADQRAEYLLGYFLDVESAGSASLLNNACFRDPFHYQMQIATTSAGETKATAIDLVETFNWLLGLQVKQIDSQRGFLTVTGIQRAGGRTLVIWRTLSADPAADPTADNLALERYLARLAINPADTEYDFIYVNGSHTLPDPHKKIHLIEETFQRRMFADQGVGL